MCFQLSAGQCKQGRCHDFSHGHAWRHRWLLLGVHADPTYPRAAVGPLGKHTHGHWLSSHFIASAVGGIGTQGSGGGGHRGCHFYSRPGIYLMYVKSFNLTTAVQEETPIIPFYSPSRPTQTS